MHNGSVAWLAALPPGETLCGETWASPAGGFWAVCVGGALFWTLWRLLGGRLALLSQGIIMNRVAIYNELLYNMQ